MDKQPLNTGEQKDMTEFFTDLISKLEEMSPEMVLNLLMFKLFFFRFFIFVCLLKNQKYAT
jgi:hypothetical protein